MRDNLRASGEALLKLRRRRQDDAARGFVRSQRRLDAIAGRVDELRDALARHDDAARRAILSGRTGAKLEMYRQCLREATRLLADKTAGLQRARRELETRRTWLLDAVRQRRAAGALRDRLVQREMMMRRTIETAEADDLHAMYRAGSGREQAAL